MVTREEVIYAYRLLLGRDPESESAIEGHLRASDWRALRNRFVRSAEFRATGTGERTMGWERHGNLLGEAHRVDVQIPEHLFDRLLQYVQNMWEWLGTEKPYWSVLTNPIFLPDKIETTRDQFYNSGAESWKFCEHAAARAGKALPANWRVFELGCGVGRETVHLAKQFSRVVACDISNAHLEIAREHLAELAIDNVTFLRLTGIRDLVNLNPIDFFYSVIVLQHNPPPLIYKMLKILLEKLRPGGCAYFQIPVALGNYTFSIDEYLDRLQPTEAVMETHLLPQAELFRLLDEQGLRILDLQQDIWQPPPFVSFSILAEKLC